MNTCTYAGQNIEISYDAKLCIHAAECVCSAPEVFNPQVKPCMAPDNFSPIPRC
jgi:uncharacterized Fe-S cluster protein YjdI